MTLRPAAAHRSAKCSDSQTEVRSRRQHIFLCPGKILKQPLEGCTGMTN
ncbi:hypothetical protein QUA56_28380 [Microcoleus sp. N3A4]